ncbi:MAG TPA: hypothetical protein PJ984_02595 [Candidatus Saccharibacteria bacterium]|mgnify:CR=1 FL=1|jgi:hypothetical protein|nr:hypothetical protein [Candidatus Saccharibacteria bacterium]
MNETIPTQNERSVFKDSVIRVGKIVGGFVVGAASGYALSKGVEQIIPIEGTFTAPYEGIVTGTFAVLGAGLTAEIVE